jgi:hypothetical protein
MNIEQTKEAIRVMQAFVDGKEVEVKGMTSSLVWMPAGAPCWNWQMMEYRIKPTATLRPWTADEVPLGAWMRFKKVIDDRSVLAWTSTQRDRDMWLEEREHSIDGGKNWLPCGVVEESK